jgi:hypothetical protein
VGRSLTWKTIKASAIGTSHLDSQTECQDSHKVNIVQIKDGSQYLIIAVSDGAGSAINSSIGSKTTCETIVNLITQSLEKDQDTAITEGNASQWVQTARDEINLIAEKEGLEAREYACTLLCAVISNNEALFFQIGDGAIVVSKSGLMGVVFWPDNGEYANSTYFITDENAIDRLRTLKVESNIDELAVLSDGIQNLALINSSKKPHHPFFDSMFNFLRKIEDANYDDLDKKLESFLQSENINSRTDDDKTLVLATRV